METTSSLTTMGLINLYEKDRLYHLLHRAVETPAVLSDPNWWSQVFTTAWSVREVRNAMLTFLQGYKTYIIAALTAVLTLLHSLGKIDDATYQTLLGLLGSGAVASVAAKINRMSQKP